MDGVVNKLKHKLWRDFFEKTHFTSDVDFNVWVDSAYLILLQKVKKECCLQRYIDRVLALREVNGAWGVLSEEGSWASYKNTLIAYEAISAFINFEERQKTEFFLDNYRGNRWVDPYTKVLLKNYQSKMKPLPFFVVKPPVLLVKMLTSINFLLPCCSSWTIFLNQSIWTQNALPQLYCCMYSLSKRKKSKKYYKMLHLVIESQLENGSWFGTALPTIGGVYALFLEHGADHDGVIKGLKYLERSLRNDFSLNRFNLQNWNTSLALIALLSSGKKGESGQVHNALMFLLRNQSSNGGWAFHPDVAHLPDSDDTALALTAILLYEEGGVDARKDIEKGIYFLLSRQNIDGGWAAFSKNQSRKKKGYIPPWHIERGHELKDPSTADVTGHVIDLLCMYERKYDGIAVRAAIEKGVGFLKRDCVQSTYWYGRWGLCYLYGTTRSINALCSAGVNKECLEKPIKWIESCQNSDGGWGENYSSYFSPVPILGNSTLTQTSWCLISLMRYYKQRSLAIDKGINFLRNRISENATSGKEYTAAAIEPASYSIYPVVFSLLAINEYQKLI